MTVVTLSVIIPFVLLLLDRIIWDNYSLDRIIWENSIFLIVTHVKAKVPEG